MTIDNDAVSKARAQVFDAQAALKGAADRIGDRRDEKVAEAVASLTAAVAVLNGIEAVS